MISCALIRNLASALLLPRCTLPFVYVWVITCIYRYISICIHIRIDNIHVYTGCIGCSFFEAKGERAPRGHLFFIPILNSCFNKYFGSFTVTGEITVPLVNITYLLL